MAYFPFFVELSGQSGLIVGGGTVALRKAGKLLPYGPKLTVVAPEILPQLAALPGVQLLARPFQPQDLDGQSFVIAAADDPAVNRLVASLARERGIPVNAADSKEDSTFLFPALVRRGELSVGISTSGASPTAAVWLKDQVEALLPQHLEEILLSLEQLRPQLTQGPLSPAQRHALLPRLFSAALAQGRPLDPDQVQAMIQEEVPHS